MAKLSWFGVFLACLVAVSAQESSNIQFRAKILVSQPDTVGDVPPTILGSLYDGTSAYAYFYTDYPARLYRASMAVLDDPLAQGETSVDLNTDVTVVDQVSGATFGMIDTNPYEPRAIISGYGAIYVVDLTFFGFVAPRALTIPGWQANSGQVYFDASTNTSIGWFATAGTAAQLVRVNLNYLNDTDSTPFTPAMNDIVASVRIDDSHAAFLSQTGEGYLVNLASGTAAAGLTADFAFLATPGDITVLTKVRSAAFDTVGKTLYACGSDKIGVTTIWSMPLTLATTAQVLPNITTINSFGEECKVAAADAYSGQVLFGVDSGGQGKLIRLDMSKGALIDVAYLSGLGTELSLVPSGFIFRSQSLIVNIASVTDFLSYYFSTTCPKDCYASIGSGQCIYGNCSCTPGFIGLDCGEKLCASNCSLDLGQGVCRNGICACEAIWAGDNCDIRQCPRNCTGKGSCDMNTFQCTCDEGYDGEDCGHVRIPPCEELPDMVTCVQRQEACGWCESAAGTLEDPKCKKGNKVGPLQGSCVDWTTNFERPVGIIVMAIIFLVACFILVAINVVSAVMTDWEAAGKSPKERGAMARSEWWRDERSSFGWALFEQLQFMVLYIMMTSDFNTRLVSFTSTMNFVAFGIPVPGFRNELVYPERDLTLQTNRRSLLSYAQYGNSLNGDAQQVFFATILWWAIAFFGFTIILGIPLVILGIVKNAKDVYIPRIFHIAVRMLLLGFFPIVVTAAAHSKAGWGVNIIASVVALLVIGIGVIVFAFFQTRNKQKEVFDRGFRVKFAAVFGQLHHRHSSFALVVFSKKFLVAIFIGFFAFAASGPNANNAMIWPQGALPMLFMILYIIAIVIRKPFLDSAHNLFEILISIVNILTLATAWINFNNTFETAIVSEIIFAILQILSLLICIGYFINAWLIMWNIHSCGQCVSKCKTCGK